MEIRNRSTAFISAPLCTQRPHSNSTHLYLNASADSLILCAPPDRTLEKIHRIIHNVMSLTTFRVPYSLFRDRTDFESARRRFERCPPAKCRQQKCSESRQVKSAALKIITFQKNTKKTMVTVPFMNITICSKSLKYGMSQQSQFASG